MLVDLTPNIKEIERRKKVCQENNIDERHLCSHENNHIETGVYRCGCDFNFSFEEFEELKSLSYSDEYQSMVYEWKYLENGTKFPLHMESQYGVADNIEQIKKHYRQWIEKSDWVITITLVFQHKENKGKGGGWRWHKWGEYIGNLNPQYEYLDDEEFGEDFQGYVLCYHIYPIKTNNII